MDVALLTVPSLPRERSTSGVATEDFVWRMGAAAEECVGTEAFLLATVRVFDFAGAWLVTMDEARAAARDELRADTLIVLRGISSVT
jgi:hypothetical protein